ncbi:plasminogen activator, urokinase a isoform X2 [Neoarius graeffei]|uniref:plasminogen activator, urokinase a isoform X2 n=1 Tax=Neoarius graeffei TaxID=443677 RepID=UPI00298CC9B2|nr:plasminogen activator, urokinase a isoform X2 [Neoarius graeffei]
MWLVISLLLTCSLYDVAEPSNQKYWPWIMNAIEPVKKVKQHDVECLAEGSNGNEYRGTTSVAVGGYKCLYWDQIYKIGPKAVSKGLGSHNYCRNPNNKPGPWCWVRKGIRKFPKFCDIQQCEEKTNPLIQDTETSCGERRPNENFKIIGGSKTPVESQPWLASIFERGTFICGGTLIAPCWVLTAAHCFRLRRTSKDQYTVYLGKDATNQTDLKKEQKFKVTKLVLHEDFDSTEENYNNDIALLQIENCDGQCAQKTDSVRTACLPPAHIMMPSGTFCKIAGYGLERNYYSLSNYTYSGFMKEAQVQILSRSICKTETYYGTMVTENQFCAASPKWTEDACHGDSGGPLVCEVNGRMFLFGIISWGDGCAKRFKPGVYTKVTNYNKWIAKQPGLYPFTEGIMYPKKN